MKKFFNSVLMIVMVMSLTSCAFFKEKVVPQSKQKAADGIVKAISNVGECSGTSAIQADVEKLLKIESDESMVVKALGSSAPEGAQEEGVVSEICKAAANLALPALLNKGVPASWDCKLTNLKSKVGELAAMACGKIPL